MSVIATCPKCNSRLAVRSDTIAAGMNIQCPTCNVPMSLPTQIVPDSRESNPSTATFAGCPHCHRHVLNDGSFAGQVVSCPHCRNSFLMPTAWPITPANAAGSLRVRVVFTIQGHDRRPDYGTSVIVIPIELREKVPIWVIDGLEWEALRDEGMDEVCQWAGSVGVRSKTVNYEGEATIDDLRPGRYWLVVMSYSTRLPIGVVVGGANPTPEVLLRHFTDIDYGIAQERKVFTEQIEILPGQTVVREQCFTTAPGIPVRTYDELMARVERDVSRERRREPRQRRRRPTNDGSGCLLSALVVAFVFVVGLLFLLPSAAGR